MDIESHKVLLNMEDRLKANLQSIIEKSFDLKVEKAKVERQLEKVRIELGQIQVTDKDVTGHE